jgi:large subunit ribosomal protein L10
MVSEKKIGIVHDLAKEFGNYPVIGLLDMFKMPAKQMQEMRDKLRGKALIRMTKKGLIQRALEKSDRPNIKELERMIQNQPALLFSRENPFDLARVIDTSKSAAPAKSGDIAPKDIVVKAGPTSLKPGPVIGEFQRVRIPAGVEGDKIVIKSDTVVTKQGQEITKNVSDILMKLGIEPIEIGLNLVCIWDNGTIYNREILFTPLEKYTEDLTKAYRMAFNLAMNAGYLTKDTIQPLLGKAHMSAMGLAMSANIITKETLPLILAKANAQMAELSKKANLSAPAEEGQKGE